MNNQNKEHKVTCHHRTEHIHDVPNGVTCRCICTCFIPENAQRTGDMGRVDLKVNIKSENDGPKVWCDGGIDCRCICHQKDYEPPKDLLKAKLHYVAKPTGHASKFAFGDEWYAGYNYAIDEILKYLDE